MPDYSGYLPSLSQTFLNSASIMSAASSTSSEEDHWYEDAEELDEIARLVERDHLERVNRLNQVYRMELNYRDHLRLYRMEMDRRDHLRLSFRRIA